MQNTVVSMMVEGTAYRFDPRTFSLEEAGE
jgi:hypothetical protein